LAGPLAGVRVLELAHVMAGPVCGLMLADMGADVVKVERLPNGDATRGFLPPDVKGESAAFMMMNRGKRGIAVDLRTEDGVAVVRRLAETADVLVENFRVGTMEKIGLGWETLSADNPRLVYCQVTGFGRTGPMAEQGGFDLIAQGYSGLMSITGDPHGTAPVKVGAPITDITAGILAAYGVVCALLQRDRTGEGQLVDTSLFEAGIAQTYWQSAIALATGTSPGPLGSAHPLTAPYQAFRTVDGWVNVGASNEATWTRLTDALGRADLREDARFADNAARMAHLPELVDALSPSFATRGTEAWIEALGAAGVPVGPVASIGEMLEHPQTKARDMVIEVEHERVGKMRSLGGPVKLSYSAPSGRAGARADRGAPLLGQHTREVLLEADWSDEQIDALAEHGSVLAV